MKSKNVLLTLAIVFYCLMLSSCSNEGKGDVEYIPYQETSDGQWGMISMDGKVLFSDEFKNKPTVVRDGRFFVHTAENVWEMYSAEAKPRKIGKDYAHTSGFRNGIALVAEKNKPVSIIDADGKEIKLLDKIEGKIVDGVRAFEDDYAVFMTADSLWGVIDKSGRCVIKPEYCYLNNYGDGKFIGINNKYGKYVKNGNKDKTKVSVIDANGKVLLELSGNKYENIQNQFVDGLLAVSVKKDGKENWGIINDKGEIVVKPSTKIKNIGSIHGETFTYYNGEGWGLMNTKGETLIRAKYEWLYYDQDNILVAIIKDGETYQFKYIDTEDNRISDDTYVKATPFSMFDGNHAFVKPNDKIYSIIDKDCKQLEGLPDISEIGTYEGESYVCSDYVDLNKLLADFNITENSVIGITSNSTPQQIVQMSVKLGTAIGDKKHPAGSPYWYDSTNEVYLYHDTGGIRGYVDLTFSGNLSKQTYRTKRVIDYYGYYYDWYHDEKIPTGYVWNSVKINIFTLSFDNTGRMKGKMRDLYNLLSGIFKKMGNVVKENNGAVIIDLKNDRRAFVVMSKYQVISFWGNLAPANEIDITKYKDAVEEDDLSDVKYGYLNDLFPDKIPVNDVNSVDSDSVAVVYPPMN